MPYGIIDPFTPRASLTIFIAAAAVSLLQIVRLKVRVGDMPQWGFL